LQKIFFYKNAIGNHKEYLAIQEHFCEDACTEFTDFTLLSEVIGKDENPVCIVRLEQIRNLEKKIYKAVVDQVHMIKYISLIHPNDLDVVPRLLKSGTKSILFTDDPTSLIIDCIEKTQTFGGYLSPRIVAKINKPDQHMIDIQYKITKRQRQVLQELLNGNSDKIIADKLNISYQTIKSYRKILYKLFNVSSQGELFALHSL
jgi:DNA-binding NarL/FixJ family response regulator